MRGWAVLLIAAAALCMALPGCIGGQEQNRTEICLANCTNEVSPVCGTGNITYQNACQAACLGFPDAFAGACDECTDSDGGKNPSVRGIATGRTARQTDYCARFDSVEEYYCEGGFVGKETIPCGEGSECRDGSCAAAMPKAPDAPCNDSDGGENVLVKGAVSGAQGAFEDSCEDNKRVREYYCGSDGMRSTVKECASGYECSQGRCMKVSGSCTDTDSGRDAGNEGKVEVRTGLVIAEYLDKCLDDYTVREYYCSGGDFVTEAIHCEEGFRCVQASCREALCTDSDDGYSIFKEGAANKADTLMRDFCVGQSSGYEYYCDENRIVNSSFECPSGYSCEDGRCTD